MGQTNRLNGPGSLTAHSYSTVPDTLLGSRRPIKVIVIGFGMSGINLSYILSQQIRDSGITLQFYEKNPELGGTWYENKYPGCACDIPGVAYQFSWHPNLDWKRYYPSQDEIQSYLKRVVADHGLDNGVKYNHSVTGAFWNAEEGRWKVTVEPNDDPNGAFDDHAEILINATGLLNKWKWPLIPGLEKFKNRVHTAAWDDSIELANKMVGVIGNGSSSIQVVPAIIDKVRHLETFVRSPTWITQPFGAIFAGEHGSNVKYSEEQKQFFSENPNEYLAYRKAVERDLIPTFDTCIKGSKEQVEWAEASLHHMNDYYSQKSMVHDLRKKPELVDKLIPKHFAIGCKRPSPGNGYLEAITSEKCDVIFTKITEITEEGLITEDGATHKLDVLICGTGFDTTYKPRFPIIGCNNLDMRDAFSESPESYLSVMAADFPNYLMMLGPFAPYGHGSIVPFIEAVTRHITMVLEKFQTQNIKSFVPKRDAVAELKQHRELFLKRTIWNAPCSTWYKLGPNGENIMMWPGSRLHSFNIMLNPRWEDYDWEYMLPNRYSYWGNGFTTTDREEGADKAWYIEKI